MDQWINHVQPRGTKGIIIGTTVSLPISNKFPRHPTIVQEDVIESWNQPRFGSRMFSYSHYSFQETPPGDQLVGPEFSLYGHLLGALLALLCAAKDPSMARPRPASLLQRLRVLLY